MINSKSQPRIKKSIVCFYIGSIFSMVISCNHTPKAETKYISPAIATKDSSHAKFKLADVDNKLDPSCMMPLTAGIGDTAHYKNYVLGFCSAECKKDFFKDPEGNLKLAQLKK
jgi:YHS domain-containing protein